MKAARYYDNKDIRIEDIDAPEVQPGTVGIDVAWCGICGTDLHEYLDGPLFVPPHGQPHPISGESAPVTLGHEMSGVVYEVGDGVEGLEVGDHVVVEPYIIGEDVDTGPENKDYHLSENMNFIGLAGGGGGLGEKIVVKQRWVHKVDKKVPLDQAALIEPLTVGAHAVERADVKEGDLALIGGAGPIGLLTGAVLKAKGVTVVMSELSSLRRQKAEESGVADYTFDPRESDVVEEVRKLSRDGKGADVAFEATSVQVVLDTLMDAVRPTGRIVVISIWNNRSDFDMHKLVMKEIDLRGTIAYVNNHPETIKMVEEGKVNLEPFITGKIGLEGLVDEGFDTLINKNETAVKILVSPSGKGL